MLAKQEPMHPVQSPQPMRNNTDARDLPDTLCLAPWSRLEVRPDGSVSPCCTRASVVDQQGKTYNVTQHSLQEIYFSQDLTQLRQSFLAGEKPASCDQCWKEEQLGTQSIRQLTQWELRDVADQINWHKDSFDHVKSVGLALGNVCNLKCRICNDNFSSSWASENLQTVPADQKKHSAVYFKLQDRAWVYQPQNLWNELLSCLDQLQEIKFTGGEPLLIRQQYDFIKTVAQTPWAQRITLNYVTNGTQYDPELIEHWQKFKHVHVNLSIDDIGARFEYERKGASWNEVEQNIQRYFAMDASKFTVRINCTVSVFNVYYLPEICAWLDQLGANHSRLAVLYAPQALSLSNLPVAIGARIIEHLDQHQFSPQFKEKINYIKKSLLSSPNTNPQRVWEKIHNLDRLRNESFSETFPEMAKLLKDAVDSNNNLTL